MKVAARCISAYAASPDSPWSVTIPWSTKVPTPATPTVSVAGPYYGPANVTITVNWSTCPTGTSTGYSVSGNDYSTAKSHRSWTQVGTTTWSAQIQCRGPNAAGGWSGAAYGSITLHQPPPPKKPIYAVSATSYWTSCYGYAVTYLRAGSSAESQEYTAPTSWQGYSRARVNGRLHDAGNTVTTSWPKTLVLSTGIGTGNQIDAVYAWSRGYANGFWTGWSQNNILYSSRSC